MVPVLLMENDPVPRAVLLLMFNPPAARLNPPVEVFVPESVSVPVPSFFNVVEAPASALEMESLVLLTVIVVFAARLMVPPESAIAPEPAAKMILPEATVPDTAMEPAASPVDPFPKFSESEVVVVTALGTAAPVLLVLHPCVLSAVVGTAQVPAAVPKPGLAPSLSQ